MHVMDCWQRWGKLLSCFGAESNHRFSVDVFSFAYNRACTTVLAFDVRRLHLAVCDTQTFAERFLAGTITSWEGQTLDLGTWGLADLLNSSTELVVPFGRCYRGDLVVWIAENVQRIGLAQCFLQVTAACGSRYLALVHELTHVRSGAWSYTQMTIVDSGLLFSTVPFVTEDDFVVPLYVNL
jgi:hypothetical protein